MYQKHAVSYAEQVTKWKMRQIKLILNAFAWIWHLAGSKNGKVNERIILTFHCNITHTVEYKKG